MACLTARILSCSPICCASNGDLTVTSSRIATPSATFGAAAASLREHARRGRRRRDQGRLRSLLRRRLQRLGARGATRTWSRKRKLTRRCITPCGRASGWACLIRRKDSLFQIHHQGQRHAGTSAVALQLARQSLVLLKNDGILPLNRAKLKHIAVIGPNGDSGPCWRGIITAPLRARFPF